MRLRALTRILRAYPTLLRVGFAGAMAYRAEMLVWMLTTTMPLVSLALWTAVSSHAPVGGFGPGEFTAYFLATLIVRQLTSSWLVWEMNAEIKSGALSQRLLKPIHPLFLFSADNLSAIPLRSLLCLPIAIALLVASGDRIPTDPAHLALVALSLVGAWLLNFLITALIGALAFVMESSTTVFEVYLAAFMVLAGYLVPLDLFPPSLRALCDVLPFRYTLALPVELLTGLLDPARITSQLVTQWAYVAAFLLAALLAWRAGMRRFAAFGG
ncbi:ABC transporter permease [Chondromyces crocatus]|uniref:ABC transporter permease n=1 Tax=Chondromyces crocatus TaxID=52 RepID=A0A0K1EPN6_CHOCO|nr:ABC-2 family transporter protein [Chondromyces crocatus]AKT42784.1 ABC transporter permease [Chondromyces crocatus]